MSRRLGGESASQHPPGTGKSLRFGRAGACAVSVMSVRKEKVRRRGCVFHLSPREVVSSPGKVDLCCSSELSKRGSEESFPREISKRDFQERFPR